MSQPLHSLDLPALDGANPLGYLAALGTLAALAGSEPEIKLGWRRAARWTPYLTTPAPLDESEVLRRLAARLRGRPVDAEKEKLRAAAQERLDAAKKQLKDAVGRFKKLGLRGNERDAARATAIVPHEEAHAVARDTYLAALKDAVPSPELALGQRPDCTIEEFRQHARALRAEAQTAARANVDLLAAFGAELDDGDDARLVPTPFCFITGSGHQWFLDTARELMARASEEKFREALFVPWTYADEKLTMRWDPIDDRRYALMDRDPTASDNKSTTVWMANLLGYVALAFFPCAPAARGGVATSCWAREKESSAFRWPIWEAPLSAAVIRSLLTHPALAAADFDAERRAELRACGVAAIFAARRIQVGNPPLHKINFSTPVAL